MQAFFGPQGLLQRAFGSRFEARPQQLLMAEAVFHVLSRGGVAMVEAGTGVGKSLAYLVPLLEILRRQGQGRAVVSTHTLHLQDQLLHKDLPVAMQALDACVGAAVAKGWGNYLCRLRLERWLSLAEAWSGLWPQSPLPAELARWAETTATGSRSELSAELDSELWEAVAADPDRCGRRRCPLYEQCFFFQARQRLQQAALVVANHALLMADVALRRQAADAEAAVLPDYQYLVVDEAHHLEDVAVAHLGVELAEQRVMARLGRLRRLREQAGLARAAGQAEESCSSLFTRLRETLLRQGSGYGYAPGPGEPRAVRWTSSDAQGDRVQQAVEEAVESLHHLARTALAAAGAVDPAALQGEGAEAGAGSCGAELGDPVVLELLGVARWSQRVAAALETVLLEELPDTVSWVEVASAPPGELVLRCAPLDVGTALGAELFSPRQAVVLTSATLVGQLAGFVDLRRRLGLWTAFSGRKPGQPPGEEAEGLPEELAQLPGPQAPAGGAAGEDEPLPWEPQPGEEGLVRLRVGSREAVEGFREPGWLAVRLASPFDFRRQALVAVPLDVPGPDEAAFAPALARWVLEVAGAIGGRTFVLFTSFAALEKTARCLQGEARAAGLEVLCQGPGSRSQLLQRFCRAEGRGVVLLGTDSFWEGVDVPGPALSLVVLARLPFPVPDHPLVQARAERLRAQQRHPFRDDALPRAVVKFRQGFGRLIRTAQDRGAVAVWDRRLLARAYGRQFLQALPACDLVAGPARALAREVAAWIGPPPP